MDYGVRDAAHNEAPDGTESPAAEDHETSVELLRGVHDLSVRTARPGVDSGDLPAHRPYLLALVFELRAGLILRALADVLAKLRRHDPVLGPRERIGHWLDVDHVQLQTELPRERRGHTGGTFGLGRAVRGQQYLVPEHAHAVLLMLRISPPTFTRPRIAIVSEY